MCRPNRERKKGGRRKGSHGRQGATVSPFCLLRPTGRKRGKGGDASLTSISGGEEEERAVELTRAVNVFSSPFPGIFSRAREGEKEREEGDSIFCAVPLQAGGGKREKQTTTGKDKIRDLIL